MVPTIIDSLFQVSKKDPDKTIISFPLCIFLLSWEMVFK